MLKYSNSDEYLYIFVYIKPSSWLQSKWMISLINVRVHVGVRSLSCTLYVNHFYMQLLNQQIFFFKDVQPQSEEARVRHKLCNTVQE